MKLKRGSQFEHYRLASGRHLELAGTWPSIPIGTSATRIARYVGLALSMALLAACFFPLRCAGASDQTDKRKKPAPAPTIISPTNNGVVGSTPVTLTIGFLDGADPNLFKALLNGTDITSKFGPLSNHIRQAQVSQPAINVGKNQFQVSAGSGPGRRRSHVSFFFKRLLGGSQTASLVPIQTRVLAAGHDGSQASDYEIVVGDSVVGQTVYPAPTPSDGGNTGFQVLLLNRSDLSMVSNNSYTTNLELEWSDLFLFVDAISTIAGACGPAGCLAIIQSLGTIGSNCLTLGNQSDCSLYATTFETIGASGSMPLGANGQNPDVAYSFIGNVGPNAVPAGTFYERLTCSDASNCDNGTLGLSQTAPAGAPPSQIGNMSGALILDNYYNYPYTPANPTVSFSSVAVINQGSLENLVTIGNLKDCCESTPLPVGPNNQVGGFQLVVVDATTLTVDANITYSVPYISGKLPSDVENLVSLPADIKTWSGRGRLFFLASIGNLDHAGGCYDNSNGSGCYGYPTNTTNYSAQDIWDQIAQGVLSLGGTYATFELVNQPCNPGDCKTSYTEDDYTLVGVPFSTAYAAEESSQISRQTLVNPPPSNMYGILKLDHQGYYKPALYSAYPGFTPPIVTPLLSASVLPPVLWPFQGDPGHDAAYTWISQQLCCNDIRAAYANLNSTPETWLIMLTLLEYDPSVPGFTEDDFDDMQAQLATEFDYLTLVRQFQNNVVSLYQDQESNVSLILQEASDTVLGALVVQPQQPSKSASWIGIVRDVFGVMGPISSTLGTPNAEAVTIALGFGSALLDLANNHTNNSAGNPLIAQEQELTTAGDLARKAADEFAATLVSLGGDFDRTVSDWGRLQALGAPLHANQIPWDARATGLLLQSFDLSTRREFFTKIMQATYTVDHMQYSSHDSDRGDADVAGCSIQDFISQDDPVSWAWLPGAMIAGPTAPMTLKYLFRNDLWWDLWVIGANGYDTSCPGIGSVATPPFFHLFDPVDPNQSADLGLYKVWFFQRGGLPITDSYNSYYNDWPQNGDPDDY